MSSEIPSDWAIVWVCVSSGGGQCGGHKAPQSGISKCKTESTPLAHGETLGLSEPQYPHLENGDNDVVVRTKEEQGG